ncbi:MAG: PilZ domain-containing protein [Deltaproteobacteria bacterium]|nr:PilZ domain-containing protein [Deltaproteobacteria bacterium]
MSDIKKVYVNEKNRVTIICPQCGNVKIEDAVKYKIEEGNRDIDISCSKCEAHFTVFIDFRRYYRKSVALQGIIYNLDEKFCKIAVENISRNGVGFTLEDVFTVALDQQIDVQFTLDDDDRTFIRKRATVRYIRNNFIGAEFIELQKFGKELGFYLKHTN